MNGYVSFKQVKRPPDDTAIMLDGQTSSGWRWALGLGNEAYPHLYVMSWGPGQELDEKPAVLGIGMVGFVTSVLGGFASDTDVWEPLRKDKTDGYDHVTGMTWEVWGNSQVTVSVFRDVEHKGVRVSYHRRDRAPIRDWRIGQRIKNEIAGPEWEAVELYPAESRLLDESNEYHLWCTEEPWPIGQLVRSVLTQEDLDSEGLPAVQRDSDEETPCTTATPSATVET